MVAKASRGRIYRLTHRRPRGVPLARTAAQTRHKDLSVPVHAAVAWPARREWPVIHSASRPVRADRSLPPRRVLVWCHQAMRAANPRIKLDGTGARDRGPAEELRYRFQAAINADPASLPTLEELTANQRFELVDLWRQAARACACGEYDFGAGVGYGPLSEAQCMTVIHDAAEITRALVGLDRRYSNIPGWQQLKDPGRLGRAAEVCAAHSGYDDPDYSVDRRGWKPAAQLNRRPRTARITGVLQALTTCCST